MDSLGRFIKKEVLMLLLLFFVFSNPFVLVSKCVLLFFILFIFIIFRGFNPFNNRGVFYVFMFSLAYEVFSLFGYGDEKSYLVSLAGVITPAMMYMVGRYVGLRYSSERVICFFLLYITIVFSAVPILTVLSTIYSDGFTTGTRSIEVFLWGGGFEYAATVLGGYLTIGIASISLLMVGQKNYFEKKLMPVVFLIFTLSLICALRLGSRTQIGVGLLLLLLSFFYNFTQISFKNKVIFTVSLFGLGLGVYEYFERHPEFLLYYADRLDDDDASIAQAGGRLERWRLSLQCLTLNPLGWDLQRFGYSHNLWLDVARESGVVPFLLLIVFTLFNIRLVFNLLFASRLASFIKTYIGMIFVGMYFVFFVEPILSGFYYLFLIYCMLTGLLSEVIKGTLDA